MKTIAGKDALVVGTASGIGRAIALALAEQGANLFLVDIDAGGLARVAEEAQPYGNQVIFHPADATDSNAVRDLIRRLEEQWRGLDILVNSAGNLYWGPTHQMTVSQADTVLGVNLLAPVLVTRTVLPLLLRREEGHILNVASTAGLAGASQRAVYSACKFGLVGFSESLRAEYSRRGLGVSVLCPGYVRDTNLFQRVMSGGGKLGRMRPEQELDFLPAEKVALRAIRSIERNEGIVVFTGRERLMWLTKRLSPSLLERAHAALIASGAAGFTDPDLLPVAES